MEVERCRFVFNSFTVLFGLFGRICRFVWDWFDREVNVVAIVRLLF